MFYSFSSISKTKDGYYRSIQIADHFCKQIQERYLSKDNSLSQRLSTLSFYIHHCNNFFKDPIVITRLRFFFISEYERLNSLAFELTLRIHVVAIHFFDDSIYPLKIPPFLGLGWMNLPKELVYRITQELHLNDKTPGEQLRLNDLRHSLETTSIVFEKSTLFYAQWGNSLPAINIEILAKYLNSLQIGSKFFLPAISRELSRKGHFSLVKIKRAEKDLWKASLINVGFGAFIEKEKLFSRDLCFDLHALELNFFLVSLFQPMVPYALMISSLLFHAQPNSIHLSFLKRSIINKHPICVSQTWQSVLCTELGQTLYKKFLTNQSQKDRSVIHDLRQQIGLLSCEKELSSECFEYNRAINESLCQRVLKLLGETQVYHLAERVGPY